MHPIPVELDSLQEYMESRCRFLATVGCPTSCRDPLAEFAEWLVGRLLSATPAPSRVTKGYDVVRPNGRKVQVRYLANPSCRWINEHLVKFPEMANLTDDYALVIFEEFRLKMVLVFPRETISNVCALLGKRHPRQERELQLGRRNVECILDAPDQFREFGVEVYCPVN